MFPSLVSSLTYGGGSQESTLAETESPPSPRRTLQRDYLGLGTAQNVVMAGMKGVDLLSDLGVTPEMVIMLALTAGTGGGMGGRSFPGKALRSGEGSDSDIFKHLFAPIPGIMDEIQPNKEVSPWVKALLESGKETVALLNSLLLALIGVQGNTKATADNTGDTGVPTDS